MRRRERVAWRSTPLENKTGRSHRPYRSAHHWRVQISPAGTKPGLGAEAQRRTIRGREDKQIGREQMEQYLHMYRCCAAGLLNWPISLQGGDAKGSTGARSLARRLWGGRATGATNGRGYAIGGYKRRRGA